MEESLDLLERASRWLTKLNFIRGSRPLTLDELATLPIPADIFDEVLLALANTCLDRSPAREDCTFRVPEGVRVIDLSSFVQVLRGVLSYRVTKYP